LNSVVWKLDISDTFWIEEYIAWWNCNWSWLLAWKGQRNIVINELLVNWNQEVQAKGVFRDGLILFLINSAAYESWSYFLSTDTGFSIFVVGRTKSEEILSD
jgi:hypothetical protein